MGVILFFLLSLTFWLVGNSRLKTISIFAYIQWFTIAFWKWLFNNYEIDPTYNIDPMMISCYITTAIVTFYFLIFPKSLPFCNFLPSVVALISKFLLNFLMTDDFDHSDLFFYDLVFVGGLYSSKLATLLFQKLGSVSEDRSRMADRLQELAEQRTQRSKEARAKQEKYNAERDEERAFLNSVVQDPLSELKRLLDLFTPDYPEVKSIAEVSLSEVSRLKTTQTVTLAIVGEFSSGKSTFINKILGKNILQYSNEECTCVPVRISASKTEAFLERRNGQLQQIPEQKYMLGQTTFDEAVDSLIAKIDSSNLAELDIEIVDTPGASSKDSRYKARTLSAIENSDACIVLMDSAQDGSKSFLTFLDAVRARQKRFYLMLSRADMRSKSEIQEHIEFTIPKLSSRLGITESEIFFVGLSESKIIKTPTSVFQIIATNLRDNRKEILDERIKVLSNKLNLALTPTISKAESLEAHRLKEALERPISFEEMWEKWIGQIETMKWDKLAAEMNDVCVQYHETVYNELTVGLKPKIDEIWLDEKRRNRIARDFSAQALEKFGSLIRAHLKTLMAPLFSQIDEAAEKTVFKYLAQVHNILQNTTSIADLAFSLTDNNLSSLKSSKTEESIRSFVGAKTANFINANMKVKTNDFIYDNSGFGKVGGGTGALIGMGHPLLGLAVAAIGAAMAKSEADDAFWDQISEWFTSECELRRSAIVGLVEQFPEFLRQICDELTEKLRASELPLLSSFEQTNQDRTIAEVRTKRIAQIIKVLDYISSINDSSKEAADLVLYKDFLAKLSPRKKSKKRAA